MNGDAGHSLAVSPSMPTPMPAITCSGGWSDFGVRNKGWRADSIRWVFASKYESGKQCVT